MRTAKSTMNHDEWMYDVLVWIDEDGDVVCDSRTREGTEFLCTIHPSYEMGQILQIMCTPEEFANHLPSGILVGLKRHPSGNIVPMAHPLLH